jgi:HAD superfamily hydrolase (TIGR01509 family)
MKNVIFDVGGVLLDWNPGRVLQSFYADANERERMRQLIFHHADWLELDRGTMAEDLLLQRIAERAGRPVPELQGLFEVVRDSLHPKQETVALLGSLSARGVPLYCLSNMPSKIYATLSERFDFWQHFDGIVISGDVRMVKPEPAIFRHLLERYGLRAGDTVFVDDLPANVEAAQRLGLHGVVFENAAQCELALQSHGA